MWTLLLPCWPHRKLRQPHLQDFNHNLKQSSELSGSKLSIISTGSDSRPLCPASSHEFYHHGHSSDMVVCLKFRRIDSLGKRAKMFVSNPVGNTCIRKDGHSPPGGPFRATRLWNDIISHLKRHVEVKRRRIKMKYYEGCFTGADAVDVVLDRLHEERINFAKEVSRDKAVKLCQLLMDHNVFDTVSSKSADETRSSFDDSMSKFYRFMDEKENQDGEEEEEELPRKTCKSRTSPSPPVKADTVVGVDILNNPTVLNRHGQIVQEIMDITGAWKHYSSECLKKKLTPAKLFSRRPSLPDFSSGRKAPRVAKKQLSLPPIGEKRKRSSSAKLLSFSHKEQSSLDQMSILEKIQKGCASQKKQALSPLVRNSKCSIGISRSYNPHEDKDSIRAQRRSCMPRLIMWNNVNQEDNYV